MKHSLIFFIAFTSAVFGGTFPDTSSLDDVNVKGRTLIHSCSYFSNAEAEVQVEYKSGPVDYGTRVFVEFGWEGTDQSAGKNFSWANRGELELERGPFTAWAGTIVQTIAERSSPARILALNFAFRIQEPGKPIRYVGGAQTGFAFVTHLQKVEDSSCVNPGEEPAPFVSLVTQIVRH